MIDIEYTNSKDYSKLNPAKFIDIKNIYNTILIPKNEISNLIQPTDIVSFLVNKKITKQKAALNSGYITLYDQSFYYFYIAPGFSKNTLKKDTYEILIDQKIIDLKTHFDPSYTAKIINGLIIFPNNFNYAFNHTNYAIIYANNKNLFTHIIKQENKYNYYMGNTNNTIHYILDQNNINTLYEINNTHNTIYSRPIYTKNYPLGSVTIVSKGVSNIDKVRFGNNVFTFNKKIKIDHLPAGNYKIDFLDTKGNSIIINTVNNNILNKNFFDLVIEQELPDTKKTSSILEFNQLVLPNKNFSNLLINIFPYKTQFELFGPNDFYKKFLTGYQKLYNILPGTYIIKFKDFYKEILVIKNDNNYFSNI